MVLRSLPPAGHPIRPGAILRGLLALAAPDPPFRPCEDFPDSFVTASGTAALTLALTTIRRMGSGREVILPAYTCPSVAAAVIKAGLQPVPCELRPETFLMDLELLAPRIGPETLAIIAVHLFGIPEDIRALRELADSRGVALVEDATQAFGNTFGGYPPTPVGTIGDIGIFSFGRGKPLSMLAGGAMVVNRAELRAAAREVHSAAPAGGGVASKTRYVLSLAAYSVFFHPALYWIPAGLPWLQLGETRFTLDIDLSNAEPLTIRLGNALYGTYAGVRANRLQLAGAYRRALAGKEVRLPSGCEREDPGTALLRFPILAPNRRRREEILSAAVKAGLGASGMYPAPLNRLAGLREYLPMNESFPEAQAVADRLVTLPLHGYVTPRDIDRICRIIPNTQPRADE